MTGSSSTYLNEGSHLLVQGIPSPLTYMLYALGEAPSIIARAVNDAIEEEEETTKKDILQTYPQYDQLIDDLEIEYEESSSSFVYGVSSENSDTFRTMEYGDQKTAPTAAIRKAVLKGAKNLEKSINANIEKELGK